MILRLNGLASALCVVTVGLAHAAEPTGTWLVEAQDAIVRIADCAQSVARPDQAPASGALCGTVVWLKEPIDPATGKPRIDSLNTDPAKKGQPVLGMQGVFDMRQSETPGEWKGRVYNIDDGKIYDGTIAMKSDNELYIQGCLLMFCQGENWVRQDVPNAKLANPPQPARAR
jgi:uncharacterized protein (DUF2147 family)